MAIRTPSPVRLTVVALLTALVVLCAAQAPSAEARVVSQSLSGTRVSLASAKALGPVKKVAKKVRSGAGGGPLYWGAWIGEQFTGAQAPWDMNAVSRFEQVAGKSLSLINFSSPFASCSSTSTPASSCSYYEFPTAEMEAIRKHGAIPFFSWASSMLPASTSQPNFQLADVINGSFDSYIRSWATAAREWGHPFFLRFNWEMNGDWFQWSQGVNGNQPGEYVAAWQHVHDIFAQVGADNATWTWCPNVDPWGKLQDLASLYPGDGYVDWTCLDGYNWGSSPYRSEKWHSFAELFGPTYDLITQQIAPSKPMVVGETGSTEYGGSPVPSAASTKRGPKPARSVAGMSDRTDPLSVRNKSRALAGRSVNPSVAFPLKTRRCRLVTFGGAS